VGRPAGDAYATSKPLGGPRSMRRVAFTVTSLVIVACVMAGPVPSAPATTTPVFFNALLADRPTEPTRFGPGWGYLGLAYNGDPSFMTGLVWSSWGGETATGTGAYRSDQALPQRYPETVVLGGLKPCGGYQIYTSYAFGENGRLAFLGEQSPPAFPCRVNAGGYFPGRLRGGSAYRGASCSFHGLEVHGNQESSFEEEVPSEQGVAPWTPTLSYVGTPKFPHILFGRPSLGFCGLKWTGWGGPTAGGSGVLRNLVRQWPVKLQLSHTGWCNGLGIAYTHLTVTLYGRGKAIPHHESVLSKRTAERLRKQIGRRGVASHAYQQTEPACVYG
jgi:hypothetical protein